MKQTRKKYFGIMKIARYTQKNSTEKFIHFTFYNTYNGEEDCTQHDEDYWKSFWAIPAVDYDKICNGEFCSPNAWNYIRPADEIDTSDLHLRKWINHSPFYKDGRWLQTKNTSK